MLVGVAHWAAFAALLVWHDALPWPLVVVAFGVLAAWYLSFQHEVIHGHPTPWSWLNRAVAAPPLSLWLPFGVYEETHLDHHRVELTVPGVDPESFYVSEEQWRSASAPRRWLLRANRTLVGRLLVGPLIGPPALVVHQLRRTAREPEQRRVWATHAMAATAVGAVVFGVAGVPAWQYLVGYCWMGMSLTYVRSFVEHLTVPEPATRAAMVRTGWFFSLLFLNNNLHHTHHALPGAPWYRLPRLSEEMGADGAAAEGAGLYHGYREVIRRYALHPFSTPVIPKVDAESRS